MPSFGMTVGANNFALGNLGQNLVITSRRRGSDVEDFLATYVIELHYVIRISATTVGAGNVFGYPNSFSGLGLVGQPGSPLDR